MKKNIKECKLVYAYIHARVHQSHKEQGPTEENVNDTMISAPERLLSYELLISRNKARDACSALIKHGYLNSQSKGRRVLYRLTEHVLDISSITQAINRIDNDEVNELLTYFNQCLQRNGVSRYLRLEEDNKYHMLFLQEFREMFKGDLNKCKILINSCADIFNYRFGVKSAQTLATQIRKTWEQPFKRERVNAARDWSKPDKFLRRRYHLRKEGIDIFLLDDPFDPRIEIDENE